MVSSNYQGSRVGFVLSEPSPGQDVPADDMVPVPVEALHSMKAYMRNLEHAVQVLGQANPDLLRKVMAGAA
jgi:hypothetical protein